MGKRYGDLGLVGSQTEQDALVPGTHVEVRLPHADAASVSGWMNALQVGLLESDEWQMRTRQLRAASYELQAASCEL